MDQQLDKNGFAPMQPIVITARPPEKSKHHGATLMALPPWCQDAKEIEGYYECYGPLHGECTVLVVSPDNPEGPKYRMIVRTTDIRTLDADADAAAPAPKPRKRAPKDAPTQ